MPAIQVTVLAPEHWKEQRRGDNQNTKFWDDSGNALAAFKNNFCPNIARQSNGRTIDNSALGYVDLPLKVIYRSQPTADPVRAMPFPDRNQRPRGPLNTISSLSVFDRQYPAIKWWHQNSNTPLAGPARTQLMEVHNLLVNLVNKKEATN
jgi:hypothetical protein